MARPVDYILGGFQTLGQGLPQVQHAYMQQQEAARLNSPIPADKLEMLNNLMMSRDQDVQNGVPQELADLRARVKWMNEHGGMAPPASGAPASGAPSGMPPGAMPTGAPQMPSLGAAPSSIQPLPPMPQGMPVPSMLRGPPGEHHDMQGHMRGSMGPQPSYMQPPAAPSTMAPRSAQPPVAPQMAQPQQPQQPARQPMLPQGITWNDLHTLQPFITEKMKAESYANRNIEATMARLEMALLTLNQRQGDINHDNDLGDKQQTLAEKRLAEDQKRWAAEAQFKRDEAERNTRKTTIAQWQKDKVFQRYQGFNNLRSIIGSVTADELNDAPLGTGPGAAGIRQVGQVLGLGGLASAGVTAGSSSRGRELDSMFTEFASSFNQSRSGMVITPGEKIELDRITNNNLTLSQRYEAMRRLADHESAALASFEQFNPKLFRELMLNKGNMPPDLMDPVPTSAAPPPNTDLSFLDD